jgi:hypothetical protein
MALKLTSSPTLTPLKQTKCVISVRCSHALFQHLSCGSAVCISTGLGPVFRIRAVFVANSLCNTFTLPGNGMTLASFFWTFVQQCRTTFAFPTSKIYFCRCSSSRIGGQLSCNAGVSTYLNVGAASWILPCGSPASVGFQLWVQALGQTHMNAVLLCIISYLPSSHVSTR